MPIKKIILRLEYWQGRVEKLEMQLEAFRAMTGATVESDFAASIYSVMDAYTVAVSELIGDEDEWLNWYQYECDMGRSPKSFSRNKKKITVRTLNQLARVITA